MNFLNPIDISIYLKNIDNYYSYQRYKISDKAIIGNLLVTSEFLYVRRLFIDWISSQKNFTNIKKYQSFKSLFSKHLKSLSPDQLNHNFIIWKDFQIFLKNHNQFLKDIYNDLCNNYKHGYSKTFIIVNFSIICVNFFYKWRQKRNDAIRGWFGYDNRRKKPSNISMAYFTNIMLKEAEYSRYRSYLNDNSSYVRAY